MRKACGKVTLAILLLFGSWPSRAAAKGGKGDQKADGRKDVVAIVAGEAVSSTKLEELVGNKLLPLKTEEYNVKRGLLDEFIGRILLEKEAESRKTSVEDLTRSEIEEKARPVTDEEIRAVYESAKDRFGAMPENEALTAIGSGMRQQRVHLRRTEFLRELRGRMGVKTLLQPPRLHVDPGDHPAKGLKTAPVTIVEFSEFQCLYCARVNQTLKRLEERYGETIRIVFRDFPLPMHKEAPKAAEAAACAREQRKFWEMHDKLFANQASLQVADLKRYAQEIGLSADEFNPCVDSGRHAAEWERDKADGARYGVSGTPSFFINGRFLSGAVSYESFAQVIDDELERVGVSPPPRPPVAAPVAAGRPTPAGSRVEVKKEP